MPAAFWSFANTQQTVFHDGVCDHTIREHCRVYLSQSVKCEFCGSQLSMQSREKRLVEDDYFALLAFGKSDRYDECQKATLRYTETIFWALEYGDTLWQVLYDHFTKSGNREDGFLRSDFHGPTAPAVNAEHRPPPGPGRNRCINYA